MQIHLKELTFMPFAMCCLLISQVSVSFSMFSILQMASYVVLGLCIVSFLIMLSLFATNPKMSHLGLGISIYYMLLITFSLLNSTDFKNAIYECVDVSLLLLLFNYYHERTGMLIKSMAFMMSVWIFINLAFMLVMPTWMFAGKDDSLGTFLLGGNYNGMGPRFLCGIVLSMLCNKYGWLWRLNTILICIVSIISLALVGSMTSLSSIILFLCICLIPSTQLKKWIIVCFFAAIILFQMIVVFSGESLHNNEFAVWFIEDVLEKDMTFTNRTGMWDSAARVVEKSPIFGYGMVDKDWYFTNMSTFAIGPHNFIYALLIYGGIILVLNYFAIFYVAIRRLLTYTERETILIFLAIATLHFMMLMEVYSTFFIFLLLTLAYHSGLREPKTEEDESETSSIPFSNNLETA